MKNKYTYTCKMCGKSVSSLTKHYRKEHSEHVSEALKDGTQQRIAAGQSNPAKNFEKKTKPPAEKSPESEPSAGKETGNSGSPPKAKETGTDGSSVKPESDETSTSFLDWLDDL